MIILGISIRSMHTCTINFNVIHISLNDGINFLLKQSDDQLAFNTLAKYFICHMVSVFGSFGRHHSLTEA